MFPALLGIACAACTQAVRAPVPETSTSVDYRPVVTPGAARYQLQPGESAKQPVLIERPAPEYPQGMIPLHLAKVVVRAKIVVDTEGSVSDVRILHDSAEPAYPSAFDDSVRATATHWRYTPLQFQRWRDVYDAQGNLVDSRQVAVESKPFSLDYEFHFELRDGKPLVASQPASTSTP